MNDSEISTHVKQTIAADGNKAEFVFEVQSEFELQAIRRIVKTVARDRGIRMHSKRYVPRGVWNDEPFPRLLHFWCPDYEPSLADKREIALKMQARLG